MPDFNFAPIGYVESCFRQKFGIPRQSGLAPTATGAIRLEPPYNNPEAFHGLAGCSHIWVLFVFHQKPGSTWKARIKAPRLGGNRTLGVFASRSPNRPNPIGMSAVRLQGLRFLRDRTYLDIAGLDLLHGTPVLDIKPYLPYADRLEHAEYPLAEAQPPSVEVVFEEAAAVFCAGYSAAGMLDLRGLLADVLGQNPKPQYQSAATGKIYATVILDLEVRWSLVRTDAGEQVKVASVAKVR